MVARINIIALLALVFASLLSVVLSQDIEEVASEHTYYRCPEKCTYQYSAKHACASRPNCEVRPCRSYGRHKQFKCTLKPSPSSTPTATPTPTPKPVCPSKCVYPHAAAAACRYKPQCRVFKCKGSAYKRHPLSQCAPYTPPACPNRCTLKYTAYKQCKGLYGCKVTHCYRGKYGRYYSKCGPIRKH